MSTILTQDSPLASMEGRLRLLLPADLYANVWLEPSVLNLLAVFEHLRTLQRILYDYIPRPVLNSIPEPGQMRYEWEVGTLMFTDLAGFTPLMEASAKHGQAGAETLLHLLNNYFAAMIEIISKSGGHLLEFTGDAMLILFTRDQRHSDVAQAVRAGLRMQRAMENFTNIELPQGTYSLGMRVGIHTGRFLTAHIGTPYRMEHVLLGIAVQQTKKAEGAGKVGRVCLTEAAYDEIIADFRCERHGDQHWMVIDDFSEKELGTFELAPSRGKLPSGILFDRSIDGIVTEIKQMVNEIEPIAAYVPDPIFKVLISSTTTRYIEPQFAATTVLFINLIGIPQSADQAQEGEEEGIIRTFSRLFALINAAAEARGGVLKKVTYHLYGADMMIVFGIPASYVDDMTRAAATALTIRNIVSEVKPLIIGDSQIEVACQVGMAQGPVFAAEIGEPRGRREYNVLSDTVNTAARLMAKAEHNQILMTQGVYEGISHLFETDYLGAVSLKGKSTPMPIYYLKDFLA